MTSIQLTDLVTASRCARQFLLQQDGNPVIPQMEAHLVRMASTSLIHLASSLSRDTHTQKVFEMSNPTEEAVGEACWRLAYTHVYDQAVDVVSRVDGEALFRLEGVVRSAANHLGTLLVRARKDLETAEECLRRSLVSIDEPFHFLLGSVRVEGRFDLCCVDPMDPMKEGLWLWDLGTYTGSEAARLQHLQWIGFLVAERGEQRAATLLQCTDDMVVRQDVMVPSESERARMATWLTELLGWDETQAPPPAAEEGICRSCPVQEPCWARWGRTLPDADQAPRRSALPSSRPLPQAHRHPRSGATEQELVATPKLSPPPLWLGEERGTGRAACLEPTDLTRHIAVLGAEGSEKTALAKSIVEEATLAGIPSLILDLQGDLAQLAALGKGGSEALDVRRKAFSNLAEVRLLTPATDIGLRISLHPLRLMDSEAKDDTQGVCRIALAEALLSAIRVPDTWADLAREYLAQVLQTPSGSASLTSLVQQLRNPSELKGEPLMRSRTRRDALAEQFRLLSEGDQRHLFEGGRRLSLDELCRPFEQGRVPINVLWLPSLEDGQARQRFVTTVLSDLVAWMSQSASSSPRLLLYLDEVGPFMPPMGDAPAKRLLVRIIRDGRRHGVCGLFCTRNLTEVDYKVLAQAGTLLLGRLATVQDKARVRKMLPTAGGFDAAAAAEMLTGAGSGRFLVSNVDRFESPRVLQSRGSFTLHARPWGEQEVRSHTSPSMRSSWLLGDFADPSS